LDKEGLYLHTYMENDSILILRICQHTCRLVAAVFRSGHPVHVKHLLHARRAGVSRELCSCDLSV
jgi:hypothetical protein